jgi:hypothetical protein
MRAVRSLDDPASSFSARASFELARILSTPRDVPSEAELVQECVDLAIIVALVEAHALRLVTRRARARDRYALDGVMREPLVDHVCAGDGEAKGNALRIG